MNKKNNDLWVSIPEGDPELVARQLLALRDWFELPEISVREAACLIAGVLPPEQSRDKRDFGARLPGIGACLPGTIEWEYNREVFREVVSEKIERIELLLEEKRPFRGRSLAAFIKRGIAAGYSPPWLDAARSDSECRKFLPPSVLDDKTGSKRYPLTSQQVASRGGKAKRNKDAQRRSFFPKVREQMQAGMKTSDIIRELIDEYGDAPPPSTIYGWAKEIKAEISEHKSW